MKTIKALLTVAVIFGGAVAHAIDIPEGGDAIFYQLRASTDTVIAELVKQQGPTYEFRVTSTLSGRAPVSFTITDEPGYLASKNLKQGRSYLLYLRDSGSKPAVTLSTSLYSVQEVEADESATYKEVIAAYRQALGDKQALKPILLKGTATKIPYIQYSAVQDLQYLNLMTKDDVERLGTMLEEQQIIDSRAKKLIIQRLGSKHFSRFAPLLGRIAQNASEPLSVRSASIDSLFELDAKEQLKNLQTAIDKEPSLSLRRKLYETGEKSRQ